MPYGVQEEDRLKQEMTKRTYLASASQDKAKKRKRDKGKEPVVGASQKKVQNKQGIVIT